MKGPKGRSRWLFGPRRRAAKVILFAASVAVALVAADTIVRFTIPMYDNWMAVRPTVEDAAFLYATPDDCYWRDRPDTGVAHRVIHNHFGMRQNRPVSETKPPGTTRIAVFGDSFTENIDLDLPFSFVEVLQHLFDELPGSYEVLNFGTYSWGADQEYSRYFVQGRRFDPDVVVYVFYDNDIADICRHPWFDIDDAGEPIRPGFRQAPPTCSFPLTCALIDARDQWFARDWTPRKDEDLWAPPSPWKPGDANIPKSSEWMRPSWYIERSCLQFSRPIYARLVRHWRDLAAAAGGRFLVVMTPEALTSPGELEGRRGVADLLRSLDIPVSDLTGAFQRYGEIVSKPLRFASDHHWNEEGGKLAAVEMFRFILENIGVSQPSDDEVGRALARYYQAFPSSEVAATLLGPDTHATPEELRAVVARIRGEERKLGFDDCAELSGAP